MDVGWRSPVGPKRGGSWMRDGRAMRDGCALPTRAEHEGVQARFVHSGGHAWPEDLELSTPGAR